MSIWRVRADGREAREHDLDEVRRALALLADPAAGVQLQAAPTWEYRTFAGSDLSAQVAWVASQGAADGVYYATNVVDPGLQARVKNGDVIRRRWLLIDVDRAKTQANLKLSATDTEHLAARSLAEEVRAELRRLGWSDPLVVDSGNGAHLLYRLDLANSDESRDAIRDFLKALAARFDGGRGAIGRECHDARRIAKLPGTWARKGPDAPDRPHRLARLLYAPECPRVVLLQQILAATEQLCGRTTPLPPPAPAGGPDGKPSSIWKLRATGDADPERAYARAALEREVGRMAMTRPGELNNQLFRSGAALGNLVGAGMLAEAEVFEALLSAARAAGCDSPAKDEATLRRGIDEGQKTPRQRTAAAASSATSTPAAGPGRQPPPPRIWSLTDLLATEFPPPAWAVPGLLSEGLTILAGKPKLGKSWIALNLALTIAAGGKALGAVKVTPGDVLYLSLEDRVRRVKDRALKVLSGLSCEASARLHIAVEWPRQDQGGLDHLASWLESVPSPRLVIIDVWGRFRPPSRGARSAYEQDYEQVVGLKSLIDHYRTSALLIHHCKKGASEDAVEEVSGTLGLAGATDGTLVLTRSRSETEAELFVTGRDCEEQKIALSFDPKTFVWTSHGKSGEHTESKLKASLIALFKRNAGAVLGFAEIVESLKVGDEKRAYLRNVLGRMTDEHMIRRVGPGRFRWPVDECDP